MSYPYYDQVERAYSELTSSGQVKNRGSNQEQVEQDKGLITRRAGYYSNQEDQTIGILKKTSGNNSQGYSVDLLIRLDGTFWDVASDDGSGMATIVNGGPSGPDAQLAKDGWTKPTKELAGLTNGGGHYSTGVYEEQLSVDFGTACNEALAEAHAAPDGGMIAVHSMRCAFDYYYAGMEWSACYTKHVNEFRAEYGLGPI